MSEIRGYSPEFRSRGRAVAAVRVAGANLAADDLEWAYLSLLTARDELE